MIGKRVQGVVEKLVFGGKGLLRHEGWVIFVPDVIAGEEVEVEVVAKKKSYLEARLLEVKKPSALRTKPPCPYFGSCGGCQLQHMAYSEQVKIKREWLIDALQKTGKITVDFPVGIAPAKKEWGYRRKVVLHGKEHGFYARDNVTIIPIECCLIFSEKPFRITSEGNRITVLQDDKGHIFSDEHQTMEREVEGLRFFFSPDVFMQNDPDQALQIYQDVLSSMEPGPILDLYCGIGVFSLLAAKKGHTVLGVELNKKAIDFANKSKEVNAIVCASFQAKPCEKVRDKDVALFDQWLVNPPRTGLSGQVVQFILRHKPKSLTYISCMPPTLARDCRMFYDHGYVIKRAQVYDMFAQTSHLETVVYLTRL
jgi:23S rRNA (uracil1939-C5)-methyltransferase